jgi:hypothetical protein
MADRYITGGMKSHKLILILQLTAKTDRRSHILYTYQDFWQIIFTRVRACVRTYVRHAILFRPVSQKRLKIFHFYAPWKNKVWKVRHEFQKTKLRLETYDLIVYVNHVQASDLIPVPIHHDCAATLAWPDAPCTVKTDGGDRRPTPSGWIVPGNYMYM